MVDVDNYAVLVHCSDGWDRTAQVCALSELMLDAEYRTFQGFQLLIQKEWLWFGHKFADRNGTPLGEKGAIPKHAKERSPIFMQFLDCVYQIMRQFPHSFQFNTELLYEVALHLNSGRFGDFFCNCERERDEMDLWLKTPSLFKYLDMQWKLKKYRNTEYVPIKSVLNPSSAVRDLALWDDVYCRYTVSDGDRVLKRRSGPFRHASTHSLSEIISHVGVPKATPQATPRVKSRDAKESKRSGDDAAAHSSSEEYVAGDVIRRLEREVARLNRLLKDKADANAVGSPRGREMSPAAEDPGYVPVGNMV